MWRNYDARTIGMCAGLALAGVASSGCLEVIDLLRGAVPQPTPGGSGPGGDGLAGDGQSVLPVVQLTSSNPAPQAGEEVILTCRLLQGDPAEATFAFQGAANRLDTDDRNGTARFLVDAGDVGVAFTFTCTATTEAGTSVRSNQQVVIPSS